MKKIPITLTMPETLVRDLHLYVSQRGISRFVSEVVQSGLDKKKELLAKEFREAAKDRSRNKEIELWDTLSAEGLDDSNHY